MNCRERVFWEDGGPLAILSAPIYIGLSPTLMGDGMLVYSNAAHERKRERVLQRERSCDTWFIGCLGLLAFV